MWRKKLTESIMESRSGEMNAVKLWEQAVEARKMSYSPYSDYKVGAALLCDDGKVFCGCNIENSAFGPTNCAERTAFFTAVADGHREFTAIAIAGGKTSLEPCYPCGVCRQVMAEFCRPEEFLIICGADREHLETFTLKELLPKGFKMQD
jgi:cytidine deaminase